MSASQADQTISYGNEPRVFRVAVADIPANSLLALASKGLAHWLGNECASKVSTEKKRRVDANEPAMTEAEEEAMRNETQDAAWARIMSGEISAASRGPRGTALDTVIRRIGKDELVGLLTKMGIKFPEGKNKATGQPNTVTLDGQAVTGPDLLNKYVAGHTERLTTLAKREMARIEKEAAKVEKSDGLSMGSLGLG